MENQPKKPWISEKFKQIVFFSWLFFLLAKIIGMFIIGGKEFFKKEYIVIIQNILLGLILVICIFEIIYSLIYDKEGTIKRIKDFLTKKRIIDLLIPIVFGVLLMTIYFYSRKK